MSNTIFTAAFVSAYLAGCAALAQDAPAESADGTAAEQAADEAFAIDREGERCISTRSIRTTEIIDERTILFRMRGRDYYINYLPYDCRGLLREQRFSYRTTAGRLCDVDTISLIEQFGGTIQEGMSCGLGPFYPITEEEAEFLTLERGERRGRPRTQVVNPNESGEDEEAVDTAE